MPKPNRELARLLLDLASRAARSAKWDTSAGEWPYSVHYGGQRGIVVWVGKQHLDIRRELLSWN